MTNAPGTDVGTVTSDLTAVPSGTEDSTLGASPASARFRGDAAALTIGLLGRDSSSARAWLVEPRGVGVIELEGARAVPGFSPHTRRRGVVDGSTEPLLPDEVCGEKPGTVRPP